MNLDRIGLVYKLMVAYRKHKSYFAIVMIRNYTLHGPVTFARLMFIYETLVIDKMYSKYLCFYFSNPAIPHKHNGSQANLQSERERTCRRVSFCYGRVT